MQTVCVLHKCLCQCGITTGSQAGIASKLDNCFGWWISIWPKVQTRKLRSQLLEEPKPIQSNCMVCGLRALYVAVYLCAWGKGRPGSQEPAGWHWELRDQGVQVLLLDVLRVWGCGGSVSVLGWVEMYDYVQDKNGVSTRGQLQAPELNAPMTPGAKSRCWLLDRPSKASYRSHPCWVCEYISN